MSGKREIVRAKEAFLVKPPQAALIAVRRSELCVRWLSVMGGEEIGTNYEMRAQKRCKGDVYRRGATGLEPATSSVTGRYSLNPSVPRT
jgi:hypothetical protein